jgi:hypothetical protein
MAIRYAKDSNGNRIAYRSYVDINGNQQWSRWESGDINLAEDPASGQLSTYRTPEQRASDQAANQERLNQMSEPDRQRYMTLKNQPPIGAGILDMFLPDFLVPDSAKGAPIGSFPMGAMRTKDKLLAGLGDLADITTMIGSDVLGRFGSKPAYDNALKSIVNRRKDQTEQDQFFKGFDENPGITGHLGGMVPYLLLERLAGPITTKISKGITNPIQKSLEVAADEGKSVLGALNTPVNPMAPLETLKQAVTNFKKIGPKPIPVSDPYLAGMLDDILGGTILGAAEGGLHYDNTASQGAIAGLIGGMSGNSVRNSLIHAPNYNSDPVNAVLQRFKNEKRYRLTPGLELGDKSLQEFEQAMRSSRHWTNIMGGHDRANNIALNKQAAEAMGLPNHGDIVDLSPEVLRNHETLLKNSFNDLEASTKLAFSGDDIRSIVNAQRRAKTELGSLGKDARKPNRDAVKAADYYRKQIDNASTRVKDPVTGQFSHKEMSGPDYKRISSELKAELDAAKESGNQVLKDTLQPIKASMDNAVEQGMLKFNGDKGLKDWKDTREKYAMTRLMIDNGLIGFNHDLKANKLASFFEREDPGRVLLENASGRVKDLHDLAKLNVIERAQKRDTLTGLDMNQGALESFTGGGGGRQSMLQRFLSAPVVRDLPVLPKAYLAMYMRGYPVKTGLLNMSGKGFGNPSAYTRAFAQDTQIAPRIAGAVYDGYNSASDKMDSFRRYLEQYFSGGQ